PLVQFFMWPPSSKAESRQPQALSPPAGQKTVLLFPVIPDSRQGILQVVLHVTGDSASPAALLALQRRQEPGLVFPRAGLMCDSPTMW
ncbi:hypothetical protein P7K49_027747, partial [Saguinus oedipus]